MASLTSKDSAASPSRIVKLDEEVINRIAAGEVVQRPANAIKELMENSLDAGATSIQITLQNGGLKVLQIQDDGSGIHQEDLPILCERFTTSKLEKFEDLQSITTYGFRGEALASISHVSHLTITTKTEGSLCAFIAYYLDGKLKQLPDNASNPQRCAGNRGTIIRAEDLFYNMETRKRALKPADEHNKILTVVTNYSIHNPKVGFIVRKQSETGVDLRTPKNSTAKDNIKILYGSQISKELLEVTYTDDHFKLSGYVTNPNYSHKKAICVLFINHRLVESVAIRKAMDNIYSSYLPKGSHPFWYLSLELPAKDVDVNVHPTKNEVHFLHEDVVTSKIAEFIESLLLGCNKSRAFYVQTKLPMHINSEAAAPAPLNTGAGPSTSVPNSLSQSLSASMTSDYNDPRKMVRTDARLQKLDKFFISTPLPGNKNQIQESASQWSVSDITVTNSQEPELHNRYLSTPVPSSPMQSDLRPSPAISDGKRRDLRLKSITVLLQKVKADCHSKLQDVFSNLTFVGCLDRTRALIQFETRMYMTHTTRLSVEYFYQVILSEFGNFGRIFMEDPRTLKEIIIPALESHGAKAQEIEETAEEMQSFLLGKAEMLEDYFGIKIDESGLLMTLPLLMDQYIPDFTNLSRYLISLVREVDWSAEEICFRTLAHQTALFYAIPPGSDDINESCMLNGKSWKWTIEHVFYPELRKGFMPPAVFAEDGTVLELANLPDLYKVFERC